MIPSFGDPGVNATFDYVVVGGGTAGLTVASRLAEDTSIKAPDGPNRRSGGLNWSTMRLYRRLVVGPNVKPSTVY